MMGEGNGLPELPQSWVWTTIGEIAQVITGTTPSKKDPSNYGNYIPFVKPPQLNDCVITEAEDNLSEKGARLARVLPPNSVLVSCIGILGKTGINKLSVAFNQQINAIVFPEIVNPRYGFYYFQSAAAREWLNKKASATTVTIINKSKFMTAPIPIPPLAEQQRIVARIEELFTQLDAGVAALEQAQAQLRRYRQAVLKAAVEGELTREWRELHQGELEPASALLERILKERRARWEARQWEKEIDKAKQKAAKAACKATGRPLKRGEKLAPEEWQFLTEAEYGQYLPKDDKWKRKYKEPAPSDAGDLPELPEGWVWVTVEQIGEVRLGRQRSPKHHHGPFMRPYLRAANATWDGVDLSDVKEMNFPPEIFENYRLRKGDILLAEASGSRSEVGKPFIWNEQIPDCCFQNTLIRVRLFDLQPDFVHVHFLKDALTGRFGEVAKGIGIHHLGADRLSVFPLALPSLDEQHRIAVEVEQRLSVIDEMEKAVQQSLKGAERLRQAVLKRAFEGKLVPQEPSDEPASALLARIQAEKARREAEKKAKKRSRKKKSTPQLELL